MVTRVKLKDSSQEQLVELLTNHSETILAQTSPQQKLIIVVGCQRQDTDDAMTEHEVNNSPAVKKEDLGVTIGVAGSDAAKIAVYIVSLNDTLASIVTG